MRSTKPARPLDAWRLGVLLAIAVLVLGACSQTGGGASATSSVAASAGSSAEESAEPSEEEGGEYEVTVVQTSAGPALAGEDDMTLYTFANDKSGKSTCTGACAETWPPFTVDEGEEATAGDGVTGKLGTIERSDGDTQVTYDSHPLYYYADDRAKGDANGDGLGGVWYVANPEGMASASASASGGPRY
jgi:predicted lipoprotein with Yx(FWY)xxD motif